jgi:putative ABC transport system permease protein
MRDTPIDAIERAIRTLSRALPGDVRGRIFEPAFEDLRAERPGRVRFAIAAALLLADTCRVAALAALRGERPYHHVPLQPERPAPLDVIGRDVRYAARMLVKNPGFTAMAVLALGLGIGANTSIFTLVYGLFLRPIPYAEPDRLIRVNGVAPERGLTGLGTSVPKFEHLRDHQEVFDGLAANFGSAFSLTGFGDPVQVLAQHVTSNYFDVMGVRPILGRSFRDDEEQTGPHVVVLTHAFWTNRLHGGADVVGTTISLDGEPYEIVGVLPRLPVADFGASELFVTRPYDLPGLTPENRSRGVSFMRLTGRLKPGISMEQARAQLATVLDAYRRAYPDKADTTWQASLVPVREDLTGTFRPAMLTLLAAVALVLLIACSNVANLLTARFVGRRREIALRGALGAGRAQIVRLFLIESTMLSVAGAAAGLAIAGFTLQTLPFITAANLPLDDGVGLNREVLAFTVALALATGLLMGLYPAMQAARPSPVDALKDAGRGVSGSPSQHRVRSLLVAGQVALSLMLLVGAGLLVSSFARLKDQAPGFDPDRVLTAVLALPPAKYPAPDGQVQFYDRLAAALTAAPGIRAVAFVQGLPLTGVDSRAPYARADGAVAPLNERPLALSRSVTPGYFAALRIPLVAGRDFDARDARDATQVMIISRSTARKLFPNEDPIGRRMLTGSQGGGILTEIVGVVGDVRSVSLAQANDIEFYRPAAQRPINFAQLVVRTDGEPLLALNLVRQAIRANDAELPINRPATLASLTDASLGQRQLLMALLATFALLAVTLATIGIYSVVAYLVGQRTAEIGVRIALGANSRDVLRLVAWEGLRPVTAGLAAGLAGVTALGRLLASQLYGISAFDPATLAAATIVLGTVAMTACLAPARRATKVDPIVALRAD